MCLFDFRFSFNFIFVSYNFFSFQFSYPILLNSALFNKFSRCFDIPIRFPVLISFLFSCNFPMVSVFIIFTFLKLYFFPSVVHIFAVQFLLYHILHHILFIVNVLPFALELQNFQNFTKNISLLFYIH